MAIVNDIQKLKQKEFEELQNNAFFLELQRFYLEMQERGIAKKQEYNIPTLDSASLRFRINS